jgi:acyl carrier protein
MDELERGVRLLLAEALAVDPGPILDLPAGTGLFDELGLDSLSGTRLVDAVRSRYGVDIAADDLNLDSLESIGSLYRFVAGR